MGLIEKQLINYKTAHKVYYKHLCADWQKTFSKKAIRLMKELHYT